MSIHPGAAIMALNGDCASGDRPRCLESALPGRAFCQSHADQLDRIREQLEAEPDFNPAPIDEDFDV